MSEDFVRQREVALRPARPAGATGSRIALALVCGDAVLDAAAHRASSTRSGSSADQAARRGRSRSSDACHARPFAPIPVEGAGAILHAQLLARDLARPDRAQPHLQRHHRLEEAVMGVEDPRALLGGGEDELGGGGEQRQAEQQRGGDSAEQMPSGAPRIKRRDSRR